MGQDRPGLHTFSNGGARGHAEWLRLHQAGNCGEVELADGGRCPFHDGPAVAPQRPCKSCGEPTYGTRHARCEAELAEAELLGDLWTAKRDAEKPAPLDLDTHEHSRTGSWVEYDAHGIYLCRVCDECREAKLATFRPEILTGYTQADVDDPIEPEE